jgi:hypothetical protein
MAGKAVNNDNTTWRRSRAIRTRDSNSENDGMMEIGYSEQ